MSLIVWVIVCAVIALFWCWILFWDGAESLEGTITSLFVFGWWGEFCDARFLRVYAGLSLIGTVVWFIIGLFDPRARFWY